MSSLHLIFNQEGLTSCKRLKTKKDKMILLGDAVYCASTMSLAGEISQFHILKDDFDARGLKTDKELCFVSYDQMVELCAQSAPIVSWNA
tara:strand:- start:286 stop:555 length:270 start_codon:yes stop_codon:yes gene_type:complete